MGKMKFIDRMFPVKYDFYKMLDEQTKLNAAGVKSLLMWMNSGAESDSKALIELAKQADEVRMDMEKKLVEAFTTPFDRQDIYSISVEMDRIMEYAKSTLISMQAFEVEPNDTILRMGEKLKEGTDILSESVSILPEDLRKVEQNIVKMRGIYLAIEKLYRDGMAVVFKSSDPIDALRKREIYHHIKDASSNLDHAVDVLHRIVVRLT